MERFVELTFNCPNQQFLKLLQEAIKSHTSAEDKTLSTLEICGNTQKMGGGRTGQRETERETKKERERERERQREQKSKK